MRWTRLLASCAAVMGCADSQSHQPGGAVAVSVDQRGVPRMVQARDLAPAPAATATDSARIHVERLAGMWGVAPGTLPELRAKGEIAVRGGKIARIAQEIDGLPVWGRELRVLVRPGGELATASGTLMSTLAPRQRATFTTSEADAIAKAVERTYGTQNGIDVEQAMARRVWYPIHDQLVAAWVIDAYTSRAGSTDGDANRTIISADGSRVLEHRSLVADADFTYKVYAETTGERHPLAGPTEDFLPHPTGTPDGTYPAYLTSANDVTVQALNGPNDAWLTDDATETNGNNVDAYVDFNAPSGLSAGDFRADVTGTRTFGHVYDLLAEPMSSVTQQKAAVTSLFYVINWLHDFWYDAGFTEAAGNGQKLNYGRGGIEGDAILAEAQDNALGGSRNNANMSTPDDGMPPRMQVFLWTNDIRKLTLANRTARIGTAAFGLQQFDLEAQLVLGVDSTSTGPTGTPTDGCEPLTNDVTGKIVIVDRGTCPFKAKALNIQNAGGVGMLLANNAAGGPPGMADDTAIPAITIPCASITQDEGVTLKAEIAQNHQTARMVRQLRQELDGSLDSTLIAHEFGHYLHHRLSLCGTSMCGAMSEGWGDFLALMLLARSDDNLDGAFPFSVYTTQSFSMDPAYFGIRRAPYSVKQNINALSYRHMADGVATPTTHPFNGGGPNSEVHNAGEVWAAAMWEVYVALQKQGSSFDAVRQKMAEYVVAGLLMAPPQASPMEVRDAILAAALAAGNQADHDTMIAAFARRGFGSCAVAPPPESSTFVELVESTVVAGNATIEAYTITDDCDQDGVLDAGETATVKVRLVNKGHAAVSNVKVEVISTSADVTVMSPPAPIASLAQFATTELDIQVKLGAAKTPLASDLKLTITAEGACEESVTIPISFRLNVDDVAEKSAIETFDTELSVWDATEGLWQHVRMAPLAGAWHGDNTGSPSDTALTSPLLEASATEPLQISFQHKYSFEADASTYWDGGVIEYSIDNGATWQDVSTLATLEYDGIVTNQAGNPLAGRMAYSGTNESWPSFDTVKLDFGTQLAGKPFRLRFRIGTDAAMGAPGWTIDEVAFSGIVGTPFPLQLPDAQSCAPMDPDDTTPGGDDDDDGGCCDAGPLRGSSALLAFGVLGLVLRRRRRT